ncbi:DUF7019 family protein [Winogradskya consettensis]|nr:SAVMC3_10250 family protein [Actinoplanes consettensis]
MAFRYLVYVSDRKIDMLLPQLDAGATRQRKWEIGFDLKLLKAKATDEPRAGADRVTRLERVVRWLHDHGDLGTVDNPGQFVWGLMPLRWGPMIGQDGHSMIYLGGRDEKTVVGLGGSREHVFGLPGQEAGQGSPLSRSMLPSLLQAITPPGHGTGVDGDEDALAAVHAASTGLRGPAQNMEFIAKRLLQGPGPDGTVVLLGSPLYVALVD